MIRRVSIVVALVGLVLVAPAGAAIAQVGSVVEVEAPAAVDVGATVVVIAHVRSDGGDPIPGARVTLTAESTFGGVTGRYVLAIARTDDAGTARLVYEQRARDNGEMRVTYESPAGPVETAFRIDVRPGGSVFVPQQGIRIPWLNGWWIVGLITLVWAFVAFAVSRTILVARAGEGPASPGALRLPVIAFAIVLVLASVLVLVLLRNPESHWNLAGPEGYTRTPIGDVNIDLAFAGPGNRLVAHDGQGEWLYVNAECVSCHGIDGRGGTVGGSILGELDEGVDDFIRTVRRGPKGMPSYVPEVLSDDEIASIYDWLLTVRP